MTEQSTQHPDQGAPVPPDFRALCAELLAELENAIRVIYGEDGTRHISSADPVITKADAALAQPAPPAEGEVGELVNSLCHSGDALRAYGLYGGADDCTRAAALLQHLQPPQPVLAEEPIDRSQLSDGYHTFAELYEHRHALILAFMRAAPELCWCSTRHADGELPFGTDEWFIVGAQLPTGAITYHLPAALWEAACVTGAAVLEQGMPWDGHTAHDVVKRLTQWATQPSEAEPVPAHALPGGNR